MSVDEIEELAFLHHGSVERRPDGELRLRVPGALYVAKPAVRRDPPGGGVILAIAFALFLWAMTGMVGLR